MWQLNFNLNSWSWMTKLSYLFMNDKLSLSDRTSFSRISQRFRIDCISDGVTGDWFLSLASAILRWTKTKIRTKFTINQTKSCAWMVSLRYLSCALVDFTGMCVQKTKKKRDLFVPCGIKLPEYVLAWALHPPLLCRIRLVHCIMPFS